MNVPFELVFVSGTALQATSVVPVPHNLTQVVFRCLHVDLSHISFSKSEWPHSLKTALMREKKQNKKNPNLINSTTHH